MSKMSQIILDEYQCRPMEVNYRDIVLSVEEMKISFKIPDIADLAAQYIHEKGFKIWK